MSAERLSELLDAYLEERLDRNGLAELARLLESDEEARRAFVRLVDQERALSDLYGAPRRRRRPVAWLAGGAIAAAAALAILTYALSGTGAPPETSRPVVREVPAPRAVPAPVPAPPPPSPPVPAPRPQPLPPAVEPPAPLPPPPPPSPRPVSPDAPAPPAPEAAPKPPKEAEPAKPAPPAPPKETVVAVGRVEGVTGQAFAISDRGQTPLQPGQDLFPGQGVETGGGESSAVLALADGTRVELRADSTVNEITTAGARRVSLRAGALVASVPRLPAAPPLTLATPHADVTTAGARLALAAADATRLEVKEGRARLARLDDKAGVDVSAGQYAVAQKGVSLAARRLTRGFMLPDPALWAEDFQDPREVEKDWKVDRSGLTLTYPGPADVDARADGEVTLTTRLAFAAPARVSVDVELPSRLKGMLVALRLHSRKDGKDLIHCDLDERFYYLATGPTAAATADATRRAVRRERWSLDLHADGSLAFAVDGKELLRAKRAGGAQDLHATLLVRSKGEAPPGTHVRFDNFLVERLGK